MKAPGAFRCFVVLLCCDISLRLLGYARTLRIARRLAPVRSVAASDATVAQALRHIVTAVAFYPGRAKCLEQSIAGYLVLRRLGKDAKLRVGVHPYPFSAHAWLEVDGRPLTESLEYVRHFVLLPDLA